MWGDVPFNIAKNNPYYHAMLEATDIVGLGYRGPSYNDLRGRLLDGEKVDCWIIVTSKCIHLLYPDVPIGRIICISLYPDVPIGRIINIVLGQ